MLGYAQIRNQGGVCVSLRGYQLVRIVGRVARRGPRQRSIKVEDIADLQESAFRLSPKFANRIYRSGESGMGYTIFVVEFGDGTRTAYGTGNAVDCITYPPGQSAATVTNVIPHEGRMEQKLSTPDYSWCLFERAGGRTFAWTPFVTSDVGGCC